jgi:hypothetical protein
MLNDHGALNDPGDAWADPAPGRSLKGLAGPSGASGQ